MKTLILILFCFLFVNVIARGITEKEIKTEVAEVTVFIEVAQIARQKTIEFPRS